MTTAQAVVVSGPGVVSVAEVGVPELGPNDVLIRTLFSGVSTGTDKWVMQGRFTWRSLQFPLVPGYQRAGIVEAVGGDVTAVVVGQQVVATESSGFGGALAAWGAHAAHAVTRVEEVYDATGVPPERASLFVSGQVGYNAASRVIERDENRVVVYGDGIIGASGALAARARGFDVLLVGRHTERLAPLAALGILTAHSGAGSAAALRDWRPTAVIDTVQNEAAFDEYVDALPSATGQIVYSGHSPDGATAWADMERLQKRELTASFVSGWERARIEGTLHLMRSGAMPLELLVGTPARTLDGIAATTTEVAEGSLAPVAAVLDWRGCH